jgi:hypothetical protein
MDRHQYFGILIQEWLKRDHLYKVWLETKDSVIKARLKEDQRYRTFDLELYEDGGITYNSCLVTRYSSPARELPKVIDPDNDFFTMGQPFSGKLVLQIDLDRLRFTSDWGHVINEIKDYIQFEIGMREGAEAISTALNYLPNRERFERDLRIFEFYEANLGEEPGELQGITCEQFGISKSTYFRTVNRMKKLLWRRHGKDHPTVPRAPGYEVPKVWEEEE